MDYLLAIIIAIVVLDSIFVGVLLRLLRICPSYRPLLKEGVILEDKTPGYLSTLKPRGYYRSLILTKSFLILIQNYLTSLRNIKLETISSFSLRKGCLGKDKSIIALNLITEGKTELLEFKTAKPAEWQSALSRIGIKSVSNQKSNEMP